MGHSATPVTVLGVVDTVAPALMDIKSSATLTKASTLTYTLTFSEPVAGLAAGDFTRTGTATGCGVGTPTGSGASYTAGTVI